MPFLTAGAKKKELSTGANDVHVHQVEPPCSGATELKSVDVIEAIVAIVAC
jgi:hypothetical protein